MNKPTNNTDNPTLRRAMIHLQLLRCANLLRAEGNHTAANLAATAAKAADHKSPDYPDNNPHYGPQTPDGNDTDEAWEHPARDAR